MAKQRILVVEDDDAVREAVAELLGDEGYAVDEAADGMRALAMMLRRRPDAVVSNLAMPEMDGAELLRHIRARRPLAGVPVIICTAGMIDPHLLRDADAVLRKPFELEQLLDVVRTVLTRKRELEPGAPASSPLS